jgi:cellulose synthase/poly-beta-1,6-N-acetylglucosamine synthase-like glycosyltransferase
MIGVLQVLLGLVAIPILVSMAMLILESLAALLPFRKPEADADAVRSRCAVLVPAHNEEGGIGQTIKALLPQLAPGDRLLVVADNCTDGTAAAAESLGATVVVRTDPVNRGKGFALDHGVRYLEADPPEVVVIVDADCLVRDGSLDRVVREAGSTGHPVQAAYLLDAPPEGGARAKLSAYAFQFKNVIRPRGLARLGLPCLLTGTGMAFPWARLHGAPLASGNIVEDMQLGIDLAIQGHAVRFCPDAEVTSELPAARKAAATQRTRWVHGHLQTLLTQSPRLLAKGLVTGRLDLIGLGLELAVPPVSILLVLWALLTAALGVCWWLGDSAVPVLLMLGAGAAVGVALFLTWLRFGRERLPFTALLLAPVVVLAKASDLVTFLFRRQKAWVRTPRNTPANPPPAQV